MKKLIVTIALIGLLSVSVLAGDVNSPPLPPPPPDGLIAQIVKLLFG